MSVVRDTFIVYQREVRPVLREPLSLIFSLTQPLIFLILFAPFVDSMMMIEEGAVVWQWFVPGILIMLALFGTTAGSGYGLLLEMQTGSHERLMVTPLSRASLLIGRTLKDVVPLMAQGVIIIIVVLPFGFQIYPLGVLWGILLLAVLGIGLGAMSYALAIVVKDQDWIFWMVQQTVIFPLLILSGMLMPLEAGPEWMRAIASVNPLAYIVEAKRALFAGNYGGSTIWAGTLAALVIAGVGLTLGIRAMRRASL